MATTLIPFATGFRRAQACLFSMVLVAPMLVAGCGSRDVASQQPTDNSPNRITPNSNPAPEARKQGMSNVQKVGVTLAGAAALYYLYNQHKKAKAQSGAEGQYYLSKNGRVYYRDAQHKVHWVNTPAQGVQVPAAEAQRYQQYQGYNNQTTGRDLTSLPEAQAAPSF